MRQLKIFNPLRARIIELKTERLILRQWSRSDLDNFAKINADPEVMKYYPKLLSRQESDAGIAKFEALITKNGWGFWAVETIDDQSFIGLVGLHQPLYKLPFSPCVEIGWRLARAEWGKGYVTEAGSACLEFAFDRLDLSEVYAFTSVANMKSRAVMERLNMINIRANFNHPTIPPNSPLREHVVYKIERRAWWSNRNKNIDKSNTGRE
jgi:RimJ/RimL family protein N-acetyltransferase